MTTTEIPDYAARPFTAYYAVVYDNKVVVARFYWGRRCEHKTRLAAQEAAEAHASVLNAQLTSERQ